MFRKVLFAVVASAFVLSSCSKDDDPVYKDPTLAISAAEQESFSYGECRKFPVSVTDSVSTVISAPEGWSVRFGDGELIVEAPAADDQTKENAGRVEVVVKGHNGKDATDSFGVKSFYLLTFEEVPQEYLAGPTAYGENLYDGGYQGYLDPVSGLFLHTTTDGYKFASGGLAVSQWNDLTGKGHNNQCSVYYGTDGAKDGGADNSKTFAVAYSPTFGNSGAYIYFDGADRVIDHAWFTNNTYAALSMTEGDGFGKAFSYEDQDWFKLTITGVDAQGGTTGEVEVYLADFRTPDAPGILKKWQRVDLSPLGKVNRVNFTMSSSDGSGMWMNTPAYFCMDNIAIEL